MNVENFLDTNILIYAHTNRDKDKQRTAEALIRSIDATISTQVLQEFINAFYKKYNPNWDVINLLVEELTYNFKIVENSTTTIHTACFIAKRYNFSFYDALIISAALENNCTTLYSEDLQDRQVIEGKLKIVNPFKN